MAYKYQISLDSYKVFCSVARNNSLTKAANELYITQPSVSMAITKMENQLGCKLFTRNSKGVSLTREGAVMYSYINQAMGLIETAEAKYYDIEHMKSGEIIIGASDTLSGGYLLPYLKQYFELYPEISLKVTNRTTAETIELLKNGIVDFGFVNLPIEKNDIMDVYECIAITDVLIGGEKFKHLSETGIKLSELSNYHLIMLEKASNTRLFLDKYAAEHNVTLNPVIELGSSELLIQFAGINLGLTFGVKEFIRDSIDNMSIFEIPLDPPVPKRAIGLIKLRGIPFSHAAKRFVDLLGLNISDM